jgi:hypothetical protein
MRNISLLPLAALMAIAAGCGTEVKEQTSSSVPQRDLTLVTQTAQVEVASPLETQLLRSPSRSVHRSRMAARLAPAAAPAPVVVAAPQPVAQPVPTAPAATPTSNRELLPGKTVTVIPVSSGPSIGTDKTNDFPGERGHPVRAHGGGGTCRGGGRGPDIGMAPAPRPDFR